MVEFYTFQFTRMLINKQPCSGQYNETLVANNVQIQI